MESAGQAFIYLDHNATTPLDPEVVKAMLPIMEQEFGNPSSPYPLGEHASGGGQFNRPGNFLKMVHEFDIFGF